MKKTLIALCLVSTSLVLSPKQTLAAFVEFNPKNAQFVSPEQVNKKVAQPAFSKTAAKPTVQGVAVINDSYIKNVVSSTVNDIIAQGLLKGEKGDKGDPASSPSLSSYDPEATGFQQVYIPGGIIAPDVGTFFAATNLSSDNITSASANLGDIESDGSLTVAGDVDLQGNITLATATVANINVGVLTSDSGAFLSDGGVWTNASSRELKENFATVSPETILEKINQLPIYQWNYKKEDMSVMHVGPTSEDFYNAFGLSGEKGKTSISTIDPAGVALAGIQALNQKLNSLLDFSWILDGFKKIGVDIADGVVKTKQLIADLIQTKNLEVGSSEQPTGITIYDRATGQPVCVYSENSILKSESGKCQVGLISQNTIAPTQPENPAPAVPAEDLNSETSLEQEITPTSTPDSTEDSSADLTLSNP